MNKLNKILSNLDSVRDDANDIYREYDVSSLSGAIDTLKDVLDEFEAFEERLSDLSCTVDSIHSELLDYVSECDDSDSKPVAQEIDGSEVLNLINRWGATAHTLTHKDFHEVRSANPLLFWWVSGILLATKPPYTTHRLVEYIKDSSVPVVAE